MSVWGFQRGSTRSAQPVLLAAGSNVVLVTPPAPQPRNIDVVEILITNSSGSAATITLNKFDGVTDWPLLGAKSIAANDVYELTFPFVLPKTWTLRATPGTANVLTVHVTYIDATGPVGG